MSVSTLLNGILDINVKSITTNSFNSNGNLVIDSPATLSLKSNGNLLIDCPATLDISSEVIFIECFNNTIEGSQFITLAAPFITLTGAVVTMNNSYCGRSNTGAGGSVVFNSPTFSKVTSKSIIMLTPIGSTILNQNLTYTSTTGSFTVYGHINQAFAFNIIEF